MNSSDSHRRFNPGSWLPLISLLAALANPLAAANKHLVHNLLSDLPGAADQMDEQLINPWDFFPLNTCVPLGSPSCVPPNVSSVLIATNGTESVSQYTPIPGVVQPPFYPFLSPGITGMMPSVNGLPQPGTSRLASGLLFCSQRGTIVGLGVFLPAFATILVDNSKSGAVYKGCSTGGLSQGSGVPTYYAANFNSGKIDVWDSNLNPVQNAAAFVNPMIPPGLRRSIFVRSATEFSSLPTRGRIPPKATTFRVPGTGTLLPSTTMAIC